jgi:hypothetical protein
VHEQARLTEQTGAGHRDLGRGVLRAARRAEHLCGGVAGEHPAVGDQQMRGPGAQREVDGHVDGDVDVREQAAERRPAETATGDQPCCDGLGPTEGLLEHGDPDGNRRPSVPFPAHDRSERRGAAVITAVRRPSRRSPPG